MKAATLETIQMFPPSLAQLLSLTVCLSFLGLFHLKVKKLNLFFARPLSQNSQHPPLSFSSPLAEVPLLFVFLPSHSFILRQLISPAGISEKWTDSKMERKREEKWIYVHYSLKSEVHNINVHYSCRWHALNSEGKQWDCAECTVSRVSAWISVSLFDCLHFCVLRGDIKEIRGGSFY